MERKFNRLAAEYHQKLYKKSKAFNIIGYLKLLFIALLVGTWYVAYQQGLSAGFVLTDVVLILLLVLLFVYHNKLYWETDYWQGLITINQRYLDRLSGQWTSFPDTGEEFCHKDHPYSSDLDIMGKKSLFQFLNQTNTWHGRQQFAEDLLNPHHSNKQLLARQEAVEELSRDINFAQHMQYHLSKIGTDQSVLNLIKQLQENNTFIRSKLVKIFVQYEPLLAMVLIAALLVMPPHPMYPVIVFILSLHSLVWIACLPKINRYMGSIADAPYLLDAYCKVITIIQERKFTARKLQQIQTQLSKGDESADRAMKELGKISYRIGVRSNGFVCFLLNALFLWDFQCAFQLENWKYKYAALSAGWFTAIGEWESLLSLAGLASVCSTTCLPEIAAGSKTIEAREIGHPLLSNHTRVSNDFTAHNEILIISGSNMSGKTTFIRTIGINLVLAQAGGLVCARQMAWFPMKIVTSMRIADDLNEGLSTFYVELKRIKNIVALAEKEEHMIFLIDEIFKGTNSIDRLSGAQTVISRLDSQAAMGMITTHDLELCNLADHSTRITNYSFSEHYQNNTILFDYKIKAGRSQTTNAKYLMKMVGIL